EDSWGRGRGGTAHATAAARADITRSAGPGFASPPFPAATATERVMADLTHIVADYLKSGLPAELVDAAKRSEIAGASFRKNSIPELAASWSQALAAEGRNSPDDEVDAVRKVTVADVNRVARQYLVEQNSIVAVLAPKPSGEPVSSKGFGGGEQLTSAQRN